MLLSHGTILPFTLWHKGELQGPGHSCPLSLLCVVLLLLPPRESTQYPRAVVIPLLQVHPGSAAGRRC